MDEKETGIDIGDYGKQSPESWRVPAIDAAPSPELDKLVAEITPENINKTYLDELDSEDDPVGGLAYTPDYVESDIPQVVPKENAEIRLERLETAFAELLRRIEHFNRRSQHLI